MGFFGGISQDLLPLQNKSSSFSQGFLRILKDFLNFLRNPDDCPGFFRIAECFLPSTFIMKGIFQDFLEISFLFAGKQPMSNTIEWSWSCCCGKDRPPDPKWVRSTWVESLGESTQPAPIHSINIFISINFSFQKSWKILKLIDGLKFTLKMEKSLSILKNPWTKWRISWKNVKKSSKIVGNEIILWRILKNPCENKEFPCQNSKILKNPRKWNNTLKNLKESWRILMKLKNFDSKSNKILQNPWKWTNNLKNPKESLRILKNLCEIEEFRFYKA